jgi:hypothetical protein
VSKRYGSTQGHDHHAAQPRDWREKYSEGPSTDPHHEPIYEDKIEYDEKGELITQPRGYLFYRRVRF